MLNFSDQPYRYFSPKRIALTTWVLLFYNRRRYLPRRKQIMSVAPSGAEAVRQAWRRGDKLLFVPNHPTHADAPIVIEAQRQIGVRSQFMAAYDVFLRGRLDAWVMRRLGAFSVDREGSDKRALTQAMSALTGRRDALTIFPEGNVYLQNDQVTPFHDGAAFLGLRAAKQLAQQGRRLLVAPVSIKATYLTDIREALIARLRQLGEDVGVPMQSDQTPLEAMRQIGVAGLHRNLAQRGVDAPKAESLTELIQQSAGAVLERLESKLDIEPTEGAGLIDRVRQVRRAIHEVRTDEARAIDHAAAATWADEAMVAFRIASYSGQYVAANPTLDRYAETIEKLSEDFYDRLPDPFGPRQALVHFNEPIDAATYLDGGRSGKTRAAVRRLTADCEQAVQRGLDQLNAANTHPGATPWNEPIATG